MAHNKEMDKQVAPEGPVDDWAGSPSEGASEYERFEDLAKKLVRTPKPSTDEKQKAQPLLRGLMYQGRKAP